jgi:hypothetical protein
MQAKQITFENDLRNIGLWGSLSEEPCTVACPHSHQYLTVQGNLKELFYWANQRSAVAEGHCLTSVLKQSGICSS